MRWCNVQRNEYDLQAITYRTICTHNKLHNNDENKIPDNSGQGWYFRFDDDNNMSYRYVLSITWTETGQLNTYNPIYFNDKGNRED